MRKQTAKLFVLFVICFLSQIGVIAQNRNFSRPTIITASSDEEPLWHKKIYEDKDYRFVIRDYGQAEYTPNFFVYGKKQHKWIEIKKLSTEHAKLGRFSSSAAKADLPKNWLKNIKYIDLPLRISGSTNFPDEITYNAESEIYYFNFNSSAKLEEMLTQFWVLKKDLDEALR
jgi:hypothetical protein